MAVGAVVLLASSFGPWFTTRVEASGTCGGCLREEAKNAWLASTKWSAAIVAGLVAALVWFGVVGRLNRRTRALLTAGLLVCSVGLLAQQWWEAHPPAVPPTFERVLTVLDGQGNDISTGRPPPTMRWLGDIERDQLAVQHEDGYNADLAPAHHVALVALLAMLLVAVTGFIREADSSAGEPAARPVR